VKLSSQQRDVLFWIEEQVPGCCNFLVCGLVREQPLVDQLTDAQLRWPVGRNQSGVGDEREPFSRFRVLDFVVEDAREQHRIEVMGR